MDIVNTFKYKLWSILIPGRGIHLTLTFYSALGFMVFSIIFHSSDIKPTIHQRWVKTGRIGEKLPDLGLRNFAISLMTI